MIYLKVKWLHAKSEYPVLLYSELDDNRWEVRKVEIFHDGRKGYASAMDAIGSTGLGETPIPPIAEIAADPQFEPIEITKAEFEAVWEQSKSK